MSKALITALEQIAEYTGEGPPTTPWQDIVRDCAKLARDTLEEYNKTKYVYIVGGQVCGQPFRRTFNVNIAEIGFGGTLILRTKQNDETPATGILKAYAPGQWSSVEWVKDESP